MKLAQIIALLFVLLITGFVAALSLTFAKYDYIIQDKNRLLNYKDEGIMLTDRNGVPFYFVNNAKDDSYITISEMPRYLPLAVISTEDKEFFDHAGISLSGIMRSIFLNIKAGRIAYGGSTITQQFVKNALLTPERSLTRKINEALLAFDVEANYAKDEILEMYLNSVYFGEGAMGVSAASKTYFNKNVEELTVAESAYLAGMLRYPRELSPYAGNYDRGKQAQEEVLDKMASEGYLSQDESAEAKEQSLTFSRGSQHEDNIAPHFALMVMERMAELFGEDVLNEGYKVKTTIDLEFQEKSNEAVYNYVTLNNRNRISNGASVSIDPETGDVISLVGSVDWFAKDGRINMATSPRQPGSSFKPIVYALAIDRGVISPTTTLMDRPKNYVLDPKCRDEARCNYKPVNYDKRYRGRVTVRRALAGSLNVPAVEVMSRLGVSSLLGSAKSFGITSFNEAAHYGKGLSLVLGSAEVSPFEMATAYTAFANAGDRPEPHLILEVRDKYNNLVYERSVTTTRVVSDETAFLISSMLSDDEARVQEFGSTLSTPFPAAVKTGTTENYRDAWTIGYTPHLVTAVWVGNSDATPNLSMPGSRAAAPIWKNIMASYVSGRAIANFEKPESLVRVEYCSSASASAQFEYVIRGRRSQDRCISPPRNTERIARDEGDDLEFEVEVGGARPTPVASPSAD